MLDSTVVGKGSDHLQLIKFWPSRVPGKEVCGGVKSFSSALLQPVRSVCDSSEHFFIACCLSACCKSLVAFSFLPHSSTFVTFVYLVLAIWRHPSKVLTHFWWCHLPFFCTCHVLLPLLFLVDIHTLLFISDIHVVLCDHEHYRSFRVKMGIWEKV